MYLFFGGIFCITQTTENIQSYKDITIIGEGLQNIGLCKAPQAFEQIEKELYCANPAVIQALVFVVISKGSAAPS